MCGGRESRNGERAHTYTHPVYTNIGVRTYISIHIPCIDINKNKNIDF